MEEPLVVGRIPFLVCAPYFHRSLEKMEGFFFMDGPPSQLNGWLLEGRIDCAPSSSFEYARHHDRYCLLPGFSTSGRHEVQSVMLFSQVPWASLAKAPVRLSPASATSNALFAILCRHRHGFAPRIAVENEQAVAELCIGDDALTRKQSGDWAFAYDLAAEWREWQNLPFSFGLWIVRRDAAVRKPKGLLRLAQLLRESLDAFTENPMQCVLPWLRQYPTRVGDGLLASYFQSLDYRLDASHKASLVLFFRLAKEQGLLAESPDLRFLDMQELASKVSV